MRRVFKLGAIGIGLSAILGAIQGCSIKDASVFLLALLALGLPNYCSSMEITQAFEVGSAGGVFPVGGGVIVEVHQDAFVEETIVTIRRSSKPILYLPEPEFHAIGPTIELFYSEEVLNKSDPSNLVFSIKMPLRSDNFSETGGNAVSASLGGQYGGIYDSESELTWFVTLGDGQGYTGKLVAPTISASDNLIISAIEVEDLGTASTASATPYEYKQKYIPSRLYKIDTSGKGDCTSGGYGFSEVTGLVTPSVTPAGKTKTPLVLIHGINPEKDFLMRTDNSPDTACETVYDVWGTFLRFFYRDEASNLHDHFEVFAFRYDTDEHVYDGGRNNEDIIIDWTVIPPLEYHFPWMHKDSAELLAEKIESAGLNNQPIAIIGHSMGGIVARAFIAEHASLSGSTEVLITLGSPHKGTAAIDLTNGCRFLKGTTYLFTASFTDGADDLQESSPLLAVMPFNLEKIITYGGQDTRFVFGQVGQPAELLDWIYEPQEVLDKVESCLEPVRPHDGLIPYDSATYNPVATYRTFPEHNHVELIHGKSFELGIKLAELGKEEVFGCIALDLANAFNFNTTKLCQGSGQLPPPDTSPPGVITSFSAMDGEDSKATLSWTNPSDTDLAEVIVRRKVGRFPTNHFDGDLVYQNMNPSPDAGVIATSSNLTNGTTYYFAVFSRDTANNWNDTVTAGKNADTATPGSDQPPTSVTLTLYVREGNKDGPAIHEATVTGHDADNVTFNQITNNDGFVTLTGPPGLWHFSVTKSGYVTNTWDMQVTITEPWYAYLQIQPPISVTLTLYVREGSTTGQVILGVLIAGHVEGGDTFSQTTNPNVTITAQPGKWYFSAYKPPYETKNWTWDITQTEERVVVLDAATPILQVFPSSLNFSTVQNQNPLAQTIAISNAGTGTLNWTASSNKSWLSVVPTSGTGNAQVTVSINASGLGAGTHAGSITVSAPGASPNSLIVPVSLLVAAPSAPILQVSTTAMSFTAQQGQIPATQSFNISNANGGALSWSVVDDRNWISINPGSGTNAGTVSVSINPSGLGVGIYTGAVTVSAPGASPSTGIVNITLTITAASEMAILQVSPAELHFSAQAGRIPATQNFWIRNVGQGGMVWSLTVMGDWIMPDRFMGSMVDGLVSVNADAIGKEPGQYTGSITVTAHGCTDCPTMVDAIGSPQTIPVTLEILPNQSQVYSVQVNAAGTGSGSFSFAPPGIFCGVNCRTYDAGTQATITALPDAGSVFASWSPGGCDIVNGNQCTVTMNGLRTTTATFNLVSTRGDLVWTLRQPLPEDKANSAVAVYNSEIYVIGGGNRVTNYKYNPTSNSWTRLPDSPGNGVDMGGAAVINGLIYAVDALFDRNLKIFNPATQSWSVGPVLPSPELRQAASVAAVNGKLYVIGGTDLGLAGISAVSEYNPVNGTWTDKSPMPTARGYAATAVLNGEIYVIGGVDANAPAGVNPDYVVEAYNPTTDQWTVKLSPPVAAGHSLPSGQGRWGAVAGVIGGRIYLTGGMRYAMITGTELLSTTLEYDPILNQWAQRNSMNVARYMAVGAVVFDSFYVIGGEGGFRTVEQGVLTTNP